jgi:hypothetical protein
MLKSATVGADVAHPPSKAIRRKGLAAHAREHIQTALSSDEPLAATVCHLCLRHRMT